MLPLRTLDPQHVRERAVSGTLGVCIVHWIARSLIGQSSIKVQSANNPEGDDTSQDTTSVAVKSQFCENTVIRVSRLHYKMPAPELKIGLVYIPLHLLWDPPSRQLPLLRLPSLQ